MKTKLLIAVSAALLASCGGVESDAKKAVMERLKDPDSAKFGQFTNINDEAACLTVNARNSMGGYTGDQQAFLLKEKEKWLVVSIDNLSHKMCVEILSKSSSKKK